MSAQVTVREADSASELTAAAAAGAGSGARTRAAYELTALVAHIAGAGEEAERPRKRRDRGDPDEPEGHIVAHIKAGAVAWASWDPAAQTEWAAMLKIAGCLLLA